MLRYLDLTGIGQCMTAGINAVVAAVGEWVELELLVVFMLMCCLSWWSSMGGHSVGPVDVVDADVLSPSSGARRQALTSRTRRSS